MRFSIVGNASKISEVLTVSLIIELESKHTAAMRIYPRIFFETSNAENVAMKPHPEQMRG